MATWYKNMPVGDAETLRALALTNPESVLERVAQMPPNTQPGQVPGAQPGGTPGGQASATA